MKPRVVIEPAVTALAFAEGRRLFEAYAAELEIDLCFQGFEQELRTLPQIYGPPAGRLLLARMDAAAVGVVGVRDLGAGVCEMKRLYVQPGARGLGVGRMLAEAILAAAQDLGYAVMRLDTLTSMRAARALYADLGFRERPPYYPNPHDGVVYLERVL